MAARFAEWRGTAADGPDRARRGRRNFAADAGGAGLCVDGGWKEHFDFTGREDTAPGRGFGQSGDDSLHCARTPQNIRDGVVSEGNRLDRKSTRLNSSHLVISYAVFCLKKKKICFG